MSNWSNTCYFSHVFCVTFQVHNDLFMAIYRVTNVEPDWLEFYNVAEIKHEDTTVKKKLGEGKFGVVSTGVVQLENGLM